MTLMQARRRDSERLAWAYATYHQRRPSYIICFSHCGPLQVALLYHIGPPLDSDRLYRSLTSDYVGLVPTRISGGHVTPCTSWYMSYARGGHRTRNSGNLSLLKRLCCTLCLKPHTRYRNPTRILSIRTSTSFVTPAVSYVRIN